MNVSIPTDAAAIINQHLATGAYASAGEIVTIALKNFQLEKFQQDTLLQDTLPAATEPVATEAEAMQALSALLAERSIAAKAQGHSPRTVSQITRETLANLN